MTVCGKCGGVYAGYHTVHGWEDKGCLCGSSLMSRKEQPGKKYDKEKPRLNLLMQEIPYGLEQLALALQLGEDKYGRGNWEWG